jgi:dolichol kinase
MVNLITGLLGMAAVLIFLGYYLIALSFVPLALIIIGVLAMAIGDFVSSLRSTNGNNTST